MSNSGESPTLSPEFARRLYARQSALFIFAVGCGAAVFCAMGCFGSLHQVFELTTHFYLQYTVVLTVAVLGLLALKRWKPSLFLAAFLALCLAKIAPLYASPGQAADAQAAHLRVGTINVNTENTAYDKVVSAVSAASPDVVAFEETDSTWLKHLKSGLARDYPNFWVYPLSDNFGIAIFSKRPLSNTVLHTYGGVNLPCLLATIDVGGKPVTVVAMHTFPPMTDGGLKARDREMEGLVAEKQLLGERFIVMGDFNCTRWSPYFKRMLEGLNARDSSIGFGLQASWPTQTVIFRIPIDQILTSKHFITTRRWLGPQTGSDHFPVFADLALQR
ncbi:MAG TPA: endonuclease/exonuclease/phosphatase family protein [Candidatus Obscuribacterales bacterium]